jgi:hypothetical protein
MHLMNYNLKHNKKDLTSKLLCLKAISFTSCDYLYGKRQLTHGLSLRHVFTNYTVSVHSNNKSMLPVCKTQVFG